mgnify:CR=1 FL=1
MVELVQGEGGVLPLDQEFVSRVAELCAKRDWLLLVDEVQTGTLAMPVRRHSAAAALA